MRSNWGVGAVLVLIHLGALAALLPGCSSWPAVAVMLVLTYLTGGIGIALGFHRALTHRSYRLWRPLEYGVTVLGCLALQGSPIDWVATHRKHHAHTDEPGDPHDANAGFAWSHMLWMVLPNPSLLDAEQRERFAPDLTADPFYRRIDRAHVFFTFILAALLYALGGLSWVVWGIFVRLALTYQITWLVNSAAHTVGYRTFRTDDRSTNCWWVALLGWGEGWHNNHHAFPFSARHGLRWFEFDSTWLTVRVLAALGLAKDLRLPTGSMLARLRYRRAA
ncbi:MAG: Delta-9 acyl-phospholipid desaturase [Candidatus Eremiobacteraeota bacterium]|nr:Delta-9 acyl-phospholipid desaturase [Candidatus Eremiobacteraeota bacterium]